MSTEGGTLYGQWEQIKPIAFSTDSWGVIANAVKSGSYPYKVGDTKTITLDDFGEHTVRVANTTSCSLASMTACGFVVEFADIITTHYMNSTDTNVGGWRDSAMRSYVNSTIYNALPSELRNVIINTTVVSGHGSSESSNFTATDKLYLLTEVETHNYVDYDTSASSTRQLDYYSNIGVKPTSGFSGAIKNYNGTAINWWLRPADPRNSYTFRYLTTGGDHYIHSDYTSNVHGVSPAFRIG